MVAAKAEDRRAAPEMITWEKRMLTVCRWW